MIILECPECNNHDIIYEPHITYCKECGLVLQGVPEYKTEYPYGVIL